MFVLLLFIVWKSRIRNITFLKYAFNTDILVGKVSLILNEAKDKAKAANDYSYRFENWKNSATDELFPQGDPVLAVIYLDLQFCMDLLQHEKNVIIMHGDIIDPIWWRKNIIPSIIL